MKVLLIGSDGQLGSDLCTSLQDTDLIPLTQKEIEITDIESVMHNIYKYKPDIIINTASYVRVDDCEDNIDFAFKVNAIGARNVAVATQEIASVLLHLSTDYVFGADRQRSKPYTEFDAPGPLSIYGDSKLCGERYVQHLCSRYFIVRTSGLFGVAGSLGKGGNFIETMVKLARERDELRVVNDQVFSPTYTKDLAHKIAQLITTRYYGLFHITNSGVCSWYDFTVEILRLAGIKASILPIASSDYPQKAIRPSYSVLNNYQLRLIGMGDMQEWKLALKDYMNKKGHVSAGL